MLTWNKIFLITLVLITGCLLLVGCDGTDLTGEVRVLTEEVDVDKEIPLLLEVPEELSEIYRVMWGVTFSDQTKYNDKNIIFGDTLINVYTEEELKEFFGVEELNYDRIAIFLPNKSGKYRIVVEGFYKQTNPQLITEMEIEVK